jgi:hypothetical protein
VNGPPLFCLDKLVFIKSLYPYWNLNAPTPPGKDHSQSFYPLQRQCSAGGRTRLLHSPFKNKALEPSNTGSPTATGTADTEPDSSRLCFLMWTYQETQATYSSGSRLLLLQISDARAFWAFVVFGTVVIIIFGVGLYSVAPSDWTIPEILLCFSF